MFFRHRPDTRVKRLADNVETLVEDLNNSTSPQILSALGDMPVLYDGGTRSPFAKRRINWVLGALFPLGLVIWMRVWRFRFRLARDLRQLRKALNRLDEAFAEMFPEVEPISAHEELISAHAESQDGDAQHKGHDAEAEGYDAQSKDPNFQPKSPTPQSAEDDK